MTESMPRSASSAGTGQRAGSLVAPKGSTGVLHKIKVALKKKTDDDAEFETARTNFNACKSALENLQQDVQTYVDAAKAFTAAAARVSAGFAQYFGSLYECKDTSKADRNIMIMASQSEMIHQKIVDDHGKLVAHMDARFFQKVEKPLDNLRWVANDVAKRDKLRTESMYYGEKVVKLQDKAEKGKENKKELERRERNEKHLEKASGEFAEVDTQVLAELKKVWDSRFATGAPFLWGFLEAERNLINSLHEAMQAVWYAGHPNERDHSHIQVHRVKEFTKEPVDTVAQPDAGRPSKSEAEGSEPRSSASEPPSERRAQENPSERRAQENSSERRAHSPPPAAALQVSVSPPVQATPPRPLKNPFDMEEDGSVRSTPGSASKNPFLDPAASSTSSSSSTSLAPSKNPFAQQADDSKQPTSRSASPSCCSSSNSSTRGGASSRLTVTSNPFDDIESTNPFSED